MESYVLDGKPLSSLRVVDLKEELKRRGVKANGTKAQLQELLIKTIESEKQTEEAPVAAQIKEDPLEAAALPLNETTVGDKVERNENDNSNDSTTSNEEQPEQSYSSVTVNETNQAIKLTINLKNKRSSDTNPPQPTTVVTEAPLPSSKDEKQIEPAKLNGQDLRNDETSVKQDVAVEKESPAKEAVTTNDTDSIQKEQPVCVAEEVESNQKPDDLIDTANDSAVVPENKSSSLRVRLNSKSQNDEETNQQTSGHKKRRWGGSSAADNVSVLKKGISSVNLKQLIKETVEASAESNKTLNRSISTDSSKINLDDSVDESKKSIKQDDSHKESPQDVAVDKEKTTEKADKEEETPAEAQPLPPAKNPVSNVLFVTGLVRPYTMQQLRKLLTSAGGVYDENKFWIDKIKSKCYAVYASQEDAIKTREALHDVKWPQSSPKNLCVDYATLEDVERCLHPQPVAEKTDARERSKNDRGKNHRSENVDPDDSRSKKTDPHEDSRRPVREWDKNKVGHAHNESESKTRQEHAREKEEPDPKKARAKRELSPRASRDHRTLSRSVSPATKKQKGNEEPLDHEMAEEEAERRSESPQKGLDELFSKTKTLPFIYWLQLDEEQALLRQKKRQERERESKLAAEGRKSSPPGRRSPFSRTALGGDSGRRRSISRSPVRRRSPFQGRNYSSRHSRSRSHSPPRRRGNYRDASPVRRRR